MGEPAKRGIGRWIFLGCAGCGGLLLLAAAGCVGLMVFVYKKSEPIAGIGEAYLRNAPEVAAALGTPLTIERNVSDWKVQLRNDDGNARIGYSAAGPKGRATVSVWLIRNAGTWTADGARLEVEGGSTPIVLGHPHPERLRDIWELDD